MAADIFNPSYPTYFGMELMPTATSSDTINSSTYYWAAMYRPTVSKTATSLQFVNWSLSGTIPSVTVQLQTDSGSGTPSGTVLQSGSITPSANFSWNSVSITSQALTAGTPYWLVFSSPSATGSNNVQMRRINDPDGLVSGTSNRFYVCISTNSGTSWSGQGSYCGSVGVGYSDSTFEGCGYGDFDTYTINNSSDQWGEYFQVPTNMTVGGLSAKIFMNGSGTPSANLNYVLMNATTATTLASGTLITAGGATTTPAWYFATFSNQSLVTGTNYRIYLTSAATASPQYTFYPPKTTNNGNANAMTFGGATDMLANDNSGSYTTDATHDLPFRLTLASGATAHNLMLMGVGM